METETHLDRHERVVHPDFLPHGMGRAAASRGDSRRENMNPL